MTDNALMSEQNTHNLNGRSFEERVMARFDVMDERFVWMENRFDRIESRFEGLENRVNGMEKRFDARFDSVEDRLERLESRAYDTKPIWERALAEITEVRERVQNVEGQVTDLTSVVGIVASDVTYLK